MTSISVTVVEIEKKPKDTEGCSTTGTSRVTERPLVYSTSNQNTESSFLVGSVWVRDIIYTDAYDLELCAKTANKTKKSTEQQKQQKNHFKRREDIRENCHPNLVKTKTHSRPHGSKVVTSTCVCYSASVQSAYHPTHYHQLKAAPRTPAQARTARQH
jgi:hypothetical protein